MPRGKDNPFADLTLGELWTASQKRAGELVDRGKVRTPEQRAELAESTAYLLLVMAQRVQPAAYDGRLPERTIQPNSPALADAFALDTERQIRGLRFEALHRAADFALGARGWRWTRDTRIDGRDVSAVAMESDAGLRLALELVQAERDARR